MATVGEATIKLNFDAKSGKASLDQATKDTTKLLGDAQEKLVKKASKYALAVTGALAGIAGAATKAYADFEQLTGGVEKLFGKSADIVEKNADKAYKSAGLSANSYMEIVTSFSASLIKDLGGNTKRAAQVADVAIKDMADNANTFGTSMEDVRTVYSGLAKQQFMLLDNLKLGYAGTKAGAEQMIADANRIKAAHGEMANLSVDNYADLVEAIHITQQQLNITGTTAKEAEKTISGSFNTMKASWENVLVSFVNGGDDLDENLDKLVDAFLNLADNVIPKFASAFGNIYKNIFERAPVVTTLATAIGVLAVAVWAINTAYAAWTATATALNTILGLSAGTVIIGGLVVALALLVTHIQEVGQWFMSLGAAINTFFGDFSDMAMNAIDNFSKGFWTALENVKNWFASIPAFFGGIFDKITGLFRNVGTKIGEVVSGAFKAVVNGVISFIEGFINTPINTINSLIDTINSVPGIDLGHLETFNLPRLAQGGLATGATPALIGEAGKEAVIPLERNQGNWAGLLAGAIAEEFEQGGGSPSGITVYMTNQINNNLDADEIGRRLMTSIRRAA